MRVLITADLHYRRNWFDWLIAEAPQFDALFIAGDLLDMFTAEPRTAQAGQAQRFLRRLTEVTKVAICSGNHNNAGHQVVWDRAPIYQWMAELGQLPNLITDGCTRLIDDFIITTVPYYCTREQKATWLDVDRRFANSAEIDGLFSTMYRLILIQGLPARNPRPQNF